MMKKIFLTFTMAALCLLALTGCGDKELGCELYNFYWLSISVVDVNGNNVIENSRSESPVQITYSLDGENMPVARKNIDYTDLYAGPLPFSPTWYGAIIIANDLKEMECSESEYDEFQGIQNFKTDSDLMRDIRSSVYVGNMSDEKLDHFTFTLTVDGVDFEIEYLEESLKSTKVYVNGKLQSIQTENYIVKNLDCVTTKKIVLTMPQ